MGAAGSNLKAQARHLKPHPPPGPSPAEIAGRDQAQGGRREDQARRGEGGDQARGGGGGGGGGDHQARGVVVPGLLIPGAMGDFRSSTPSFAPPGALRVAQDGTGHFRSVQAAIDSLPSPNSTRVVIVVAPGTYRQPIYIPKRKNLITIQGEDAHTTILTWANTATSIQHDQLPSVIGTGTFACGTVIIEGEDFIAQNLTFENAAPQGSHQAVAIRVTADRCAFYQCRFLGWQDTAYLHYGRHYLRDCYIEGSVDFIFGNAQAMLEHCHIHCKSKGYITAQSSRSSEEPTGFVFLRCVVTGVGKEDMFLGRPWQPCARVVFAHCFMDACVVKKGWDNWGDREKERTACFCEFGCFGPGSEDSQRVPWARRLREGEAARFLSLDFVDPERRWLSRQSANAPFVPVPLSA